VGLTVQITFDCHDADLMADFWATALDYRLQPPPDGFSSWEAFLEANDIPVPPAGSIGAVVDPDAKGPRLLFLRVPEDKTVKNRVHLDVQVGDDEEKLAKVRQLVAAGGTEVERVDELGGWWIVMRDPEGNEFCVT
jgi:hypothetical protein